MEMTSPEWLAAGCSCGPSEREQAFWALILGVLVHPCGEKVNVGVSGGYAPRRGKSSFASSSHHHPCNLSCIRLLCTLHKAQGSTYQV